MAMKARISATEAARSFSDLLNRVRYGGDSFVVERGGEPICLISPVGPPRRTARELATLLREAPKPDRGFAEAVEQATRGQPQLPGTAWES